MISACPCRRGSLTVFEKAASSLASEVTEGDQPAEERRRFEARFPVLLEHALGDQLEGIEADQVGVIGLDITLAPKRGRSAHELVNEPIKSLINRASSEAAAICTRRF